MVQQDGKTSKGIAAQGEGGAAAPRPSVFAGRYRALTVGVILSVSMVAFETLGTATLLPGIGRELGGMDAYGWGLSAIMLANIVGTVFAARFADRTGPRRPMVVGML